MLTNTPRTWVTGAAVVALLLVAATWLLVLSPQRAQAQELRDQRQSTADANVQPQQQLKLLVQESAQLPARRAELEALRQHVPATLDVSRLTRQLTAAAQSAGVALTSVTPGSPVALVSDDAAGAAAPADGTAAAAPATGSATAAAVVQMPVALEVSGSFFELQVFLDTLRGLDRDVLVTSVSATADDGETSSGTGATATATGTGTTSTTTTAPGGVTATVGLTVFVLPDAAGRHPERAGLPGADHDVLTDPEETMSFSSFGAAPGAGQTRPDEQFGATSPTFSFAPKPSGAPAAAAPAAAPAAPPVAEPARAPRRWLPWTAAGLAVAAGAAGAVLLLSSSPEADEPLAPVAAAAPAAPAAPAEGDGTAAPALAPPVDGRNIFAPLHTGAASGGSAASGGAATGSTGTGATGAGTGTGTTGSTGAAGGAPASGAGGAADGTTSGAAVSVEWLGASDDGGSQLFQVVAGSTTTTYAAAPGQPLASVPPLSWVTVTAGVDEASAGLVAGPKSYVLRKGEPVTLS